MHCYIITLSAHALLYHHTISSCTGISSHYQLMHWHIITLTAHALTYHHTISSCTDISSHYQLMHCHIITISAHALAYHHSISSCTDISSKYQLVHWHIITVSTHAPSCYLHSISYNRPVQSHTVSVLRLPLCLLDLKPKVGCVSTQDSNLKTCAF